MYSLKLATILCIAFIQSIRCIVIDSLDRKDNKNNLGYRRKTYLEKGYTDNGLLLDRHGSVYEDLPYKKIISFVGKSIIISYSTTESFGPWRLTLCQRRDTGKDAKAYVPLKLSIGVLNEVVIPVSLFADLDPSRIVKMQITGPMTLHRIDLVDLNGLGQNIRDSNFGKGHVDLLIDDFTQWEDLSVNTMNHARRMSESVQRGHGQVVMPGMDDSVIEYFASPGAPLTLQYLAVRIVYTTFVSVKYTFGVIGNSVNGSGETYTCTTKLPVGPMRVKVISFSTFIGSDIHSVPFTGYGLSIQGPLTVHRVELVMSEKEKQHHLSLCKSQILITQFIVKYTYFRNGLQLVLQPRTFQLEVQKSNILEQAFLCMNDSSFKMDLDVFYQSEPHLDPLSRKRLFFDLIYSALALPRYGLFVKGNGAEGLLTFESSCAASVHSLKLYRFVGQIIGMAIIHRQFQSVQFAPLVYRALLHGPKLTLDGEQNDMQPMDPGDGQFNTNVVRPHPYICARAKALYKGFNSVIPKQILVDIGASELEWILTGSRSYV